MPLAGFLVAQGELNFAYTILAGVVGSLISTLPWFFAGRLLGEKGLKKLLAKHRKWLAFSPKNLEQAQERFRKHGGQAIFFSFVVPGIRNLISIPAGLSGMSVSSFVLFSTLAAGVWLAVLVAAGYFLGEQYYLVDDYLGRASNIVIGVLVLVALFWGTWFYIRHRAK